MLEIILGFQWLAGGLCFLSGAATFVLVCKLLQKLLDLDLKKLVERPASDTEAVESFKAVGEALIQSISNQGGKIDNLNNETKRGFRELTKVLEKNQEELLEALSNKQPEAKKSKVEKPEADKSKPKKAKKQKPEAEAKKPVPEVEAEVEPEAESVPGKSLIGKLFESVVPTAKSKPVVEEVVEPEPEKVEESLGDLYIEALKEEYGDQYLTEGKIWLSYLNSKGEEAGDVMLLMKLQEAIWKGRHSIETVLSATFCIEDSGDREVSILESKEILGWIQSTKQYQSILRCDECNEYKRMLKQTKGKEYHKTCLPCHEKKTKQENQGAAVGI